jgi:hypothetical protein
MFPSILAALAIVGATNALAANLTAPRTCGTFISAEQRIAAEKHFAANRVVSQSLRPFATTIDIYFHIISQDDTEEGGNIP